MSFTNYKPQLSWRGHDTHIKHGLNGTKGAAMKAAQIQLDGINTSNTLQRDRTDMIKRGGR